MQSANPSSCFDVPVTAAADDADMPVEPGPLTHSRMAAAKRRAASRPSPTEIRVRTNGLGKPHVTVPCSDAEGWMALAAQAFGTVSSAFVEAEIQRLMEALCSSCDEIGLETKMNAAIAVIESLQPQNETEAMLAIEMAVTHAVAMGLLGRVSRTGEHLMIEHLPVYGNIAAKFLRAYTGQMEALAKLRRSVVQVTRVERVTVSCAGGPSAPTVLGNS